MLGRGTVSHEDSTPHLQSQNPTKTHKPFRFQSLAQNKSRPTHRPKRLKLSSCGHANSQISKIHTIEDGFEN